MRLPGSVERLTRAAAAVSGVVLGCVFAAITARGTCRDGRGAMVLSRRRHRPPATSVNFVGSCEAGVACSAVRALAQAGVQPTTPTWNSWRRADAVSPPMHSQRLQPAESVPLRTPTLYIARGPRPTPHRGAASGITSWQIVAVVHRNNGAQGPAPGIPNIQAPSHTARQAFLCLRIRHVTVFLSGCVAAKPPAPRNRLSVCIPIRWLALRLASSTKRAGTLKRYTSHAVGQIATEIESYAP
jgi:hypothetical protein